MPDKCISNSARDAIVAAIRRLEVCPQSSQPVIQRSKYGRPILDIEGIPQRTFKSMNYLAENFPGGFYKEGRDLEGQKLEMDDQGHPVGPLKATGGNFKVSTDIFEKPRFPDGTPFTHVYTVTKEKRQGEPVYVITNERRNPDYVEPVR
ncbi:MAG: hypothetical protein MIO92_13560 [Methanosarcinaceae archaeon]|nr:hypothetical protein [Methanosarcinaceae archaeon]